jgi:hypothetical protein
MAKDKDNDPWRRLREREDEDQTNTSLPSPNSGHADAVDVSKPISSDSVKMIQAMEQTSVLIDQVNSLYSQFLAGIEKRPPLERRKLLDDQMTKLSNASKLSASIKFRFSSLLSRYQTHRDRWDRSIKELENGARARKTTK